MAQLNNLYQFSVQMESAKNQSVKFGIGRYQASRQLLLISYGQFPRIPRRPLAVHPSQMLFPPHSFPNEYCWVQGISAIQEVSADEPGHSVTQAIRRPDWNLNVRWFYAARQGLKQLRRFLLVLTVDQYCR